MSIPEPLWRPHPHRGSDLARASISSTQLADSSITSAKIVNGTIVAADIADATITAAKLASEAWTAWTPTLTATTTNPTMGTGATRNGNYTRFGRTIHGQLHIIFGTSGSAAGSGTYEVSLPVAPTPGSNRIIGSGFVYNSSANTLWTIVAITDSSFGDELRMYTTSTASGFVITDAVPFTWANNDQIALQFTCEAAS
jgi:hypothetical protein